MKLKLITWGLGLFFLFSLGAKELPLSLRQAMELALVNNPELKSQRLELEIARMNIQQAKADYDPYIQLNSNFSSSERPSSQPAFGTETKSINLNLTTGVMIPSGGNVSLSWQSSRQESNSTFMTLNPSYNSDLSLNIYQPILKGGLLNWRSIELEKAFNDYKQKELNLKSKALEIASRTEDAYWSLVRARMNYQVMEKSLERAQEMVRLAQAQLDAGVGSEVSLLQAKANLESTRASLLQSEAELKRAENNLKQLLYFQSEEELLATTIIPADQPRAEKYLPNKEEFLKKAFARNYILEGLNLSLENLRLSNQQVENQLYPELNFSGNLTISGLAGDSEPRAQVMETGFVVPNPYPTPQPYMIELTTITPEESEWEGNLWDAVDRMLEGKYLSWQAGLVFKFPFGNRSARSQWRVANYNYEKTELELARQRRMLRFQLENLLNDLQTYYESWQASKAARELAEKSYAIERRKYQLGLSTPYQLLEQEEQLRQAELNEISALIEYNKAIGRVRRAEQGYLEGAVSGISPVGISLPSISGISLPSALGTGAGGLPAGVDLNLLRSLGISLP